ncbi:hypothetical protein AWENTII_008252 [Aspergillus wentii]
MRCEDGTEGCFGPSNESLRRSVIVSLVFAFFLSTVTVALRLLARRINGTKLFLDDYLILMALLFKYGCSIGVCILLYNGLGSHITEIPPKNLIIFAKIGYSNSFVYTACIAFIKLSILTLYKRLFSTRRMILASNLIATFVILWAISIFIAGALICIPVNKFWDQSIPGHCLDSATFYYAMQIPNIFSDLVILIMPMKIVWALPIPKTQRMLLSCVFVVGGLTLVFDIVRLVAMIKLTQAGPDVTCKSSRHTPTPTHLTIYHRLSSPRRTMDLHRSSRRHHRSLSLQPPPALQTRLPRCLVTHPIIDSPIRAATKPRQYGEAIRFVCHGA